MEVVAKAGTLTDKAVIDYHLVQAAIEGDHASYNKLMQKYRMPIYHMIYKMVNNEEDANDLTIEAFGKAFIKLRSYVPTYAFSTWLYKIAINNSIDFVRKNRIKTCSIDESISDEENAESYSNNLEADMLNPEEEIIRDQRIAMMRTLVGNLSEKYRIMINLRYFEEMSYEEIAEELDIPIGTVKAQLFRAKQLLLKKMSSPGASAYIENKHCTNIAV